MNQSPISKTTNENAKFQTLITVSVLVETEKTQQQIKEEEKFLSSIIH